MKDKLDYKDGLFVWVDAPNTHDSYNKKDFIQKFRRREILGGCEATDMAKIMAKLLD